MTVDPALITALLGPGAPEVDCDECLVLLDEYVDAVAGGEDAGHHPRMHSHLIGCPVCREEFESLYALVTTEEAA